MQKCQAPAICSVVVPQYCLRTRPSAIIFDYGNVLCQPQPPSEQAAMAAILNLSIATFREAYWRPRLAYDEAALDPATYWNTVAQRSLTTAEITRLTEIDSRSWTHPDPVMPEWAGEVRAAGFRTAILSNMPLPVREQLDRSGWLPQFDQRTFSCDVRMAKPAREIYELCLRGLGIAPSDTLFLDDRPENIHAAEALGIQSILFSTPGELAVEVQNRYSTSPPRIATVNRGDEKDQ